MCDVLFALFFQSISKLNQSFLEQHIYHYSKCDAKNRHSLDLSLPFGNIEKSVTPIDISSCCAIPILCCLEPHTQTGENFIAFIKVQKLARDEDGRIIIGSASIIDTVYHPTRAGHPAHSTREQLGKVISISGDKKPELSSLQLSALYPTIPDR